jgi:monoamine oxidase
LFPIEQMEEKYCVLIIGAGLAGLSCAKYLMEHGLDDFIIIEAQNRIGGRCQTIQYSMFVDEK